MKNWEWRKYPLDARFHSRYLIVDSGCWEWQGSLNPRHGYGMLHYDGRTIHAHIVSYLLHKGDIPPGTEIDHLCENRKCVNPDHLEAVTHRINITRGSIKRRKTHCFRGHPLSGENLVVYTDRGGPHRTCAACSRIRANKAYDKIRKNG